MSGRKKRMADLPAEKQAERRALNQRSKLRWRAKHPFKPRAPRPAIAQSDGTAKIPLTRGLFTVIDEEWTWLSKWLWGATKNHPYAYRIRQIKGEQVMIWMHRVILGLQDPDTGAPLGNQAHLEVDHVNGNGLDNCRANLRHATRSQNQANRRIGKTKTGYKGVTRRASGQFYVRAGLGPYTTAIEAARINDAVAAARYGVYAGLNFPGETPGPCPFCHGRPV